MNHNMYELGRDFSYFKFSQWMRKTLAETATLAPLFESIEDYQGFAQRLLNFRVNTRNQAFDHRVPDSQVGFCLNDLATDKRYEEFKDEFT